jgi:hypothetical protein
MARAHRSGSRTMTASGQRASLPIRPRVAYALIASSAVGLFLTGIAIGSLRTASQPVTPPVEAAPAAVVAAPAVPVMVVSGSGPHLLPESVSMLMSGAAASSAFTERTPFPGAVPPVCRPGTEVSDKPTTVRGSTCVPISSQPRRLTDQRPESDEAMTHDRPAGPGAVASGSTDSRRSPLPPAHP